MILCLDVESLGLDVFHGALPFFVTTCNEEGNQRYWEWEVNPVTRQVTVLEEDVVEISEAIRDADLLVGHNLNYDYKCLKLADPRFVEHWDWTKVRDTLLASHLLNSAAQHNLTDCCVEYLGENIQPLEIRLHQACDEARRWARKHHPEWKIAKFGLLDDQGRQMMPSAKPDPKTKKKGTNDSSPWKADTWLPKLVLQEKLKLVRSDPNWKDSVLKAPVHPKPDSMLRYHQAIDEWYPYTGEARLVNKRHEPCDISILRPSKWGNPFTHLNLKQTNAQYQVGSRKEAVARYREWIQTQPELLATLWELDGKVLGCCCKGQPPTSPEAVWNDTTPCHGDVLLELLAKKKHPWWTVTEDYGNKDSESTLKLWFVMEKEIQKRKLEKLYSWSCQMLPITVAMEERGVTVSEEELNHIHGEFSEASSNAKKVCLNIAESFGYDLKLPKGASPNRSLREFVLDVMKLPPQHNNKKAKTNAPSLTKTTLEHYASTLPKNSKESLFLRSLLASRARDTSIGFMNNYKRFWLPYKENGVEVPGWYVLHPNLNQTGTGTTRFSCTNPNGQNLSLKGYGITCPRCHGSECDYCKHTGEIAQNIRHIFGPAPGREWWSCDGSNLEVRLPAYLSGEKEMIALFEKPNDPPFFGSNHLLNFSIVYPEIWEAELAQQMVNPEHIKKKYKSTNYTWIKNVWFGIQYSAGEATTDASAHRKGAYRLLKSKLANLLGPGGLNDRQVRFAEKHRYIETPPDRTVDPERGYPLTCKRTDFGGVLPTTPLSYYVQGGAGFWIRQCTLKVYDFFQKLNSGQKFEGRKWPGRYHIILQIHDELLYDVPSGKGKGTKPHEYNLPIMKEVRRLMESCGDSINVPIPVSVSYHETSWAEGIAL